MYEPQIHARWTIHPSKLGYVCSHCAFETMKRYNECPNCNAEMRTETTRSAIQTVEALNKEKANLSDEEKLALQYITITKKISLDEVKEILNKSDKFKFNATELDAINYLLHH